MCTGYVYRVNSKRAADDPEKRDYPLSAVTLTILWPFLVLVVAFLFILKALAYGLFLILFTIALVVIRKPFIVKWLIKIATKIGTMFLKANTFLIRAFFPPTRSHPI